LAVPHLLPTARSVSEPEPFVPMVLMPVRRTCGPTSIGGRFLCPGGVRGGGFPWVRAGAPHHRASAPLRLADVHSGDGLPGALVHEQGRTTGEALRRLGGSERRRNACAVGEEALA
jgi:hypothetical protein